MLGISGVKGSGVNGAAVVSSGYGQGAGGVAQSPAVVFTGEERRIAMVAMDAVAELGKDRTLVPTSTALGTASVQEKLTQLVVERPWCPNKASCWIPCPPTSRLWPKW